MIILVNSIPLLYKYLYLLKWSFFLSPWEEYCLTRLGLLMSDDYFCKYSPRIFLLLFYAMDVLM